MVKWASFIFWNFLNPLFYVHHRYTRHKVIIDRFLEKRTALFNASVGAVLGAAVYLIASPLLFPSPVQKTLTELNKEGTELLAIMKLDTSKELPLFAIQKARADILSRVYAANDKAEVRRQRLEFEKLKAELTRERSQAVST